MTPLLAVPNRAEGLLDMTRERSSLIRILTSETILLDRISKKTWVAAAKHEALYWEFTSEILMEETLAGGQPAGKKIMILQLLTLHCCLSPWVLNLIKSQVKGKFY